MPLLEFLAACEIVKIVVEIFKLILEVSRLMLDCLKYIKDFFKKVSEGFLDDLGKMMPPPETGPPKQKKHLSRPDDYRAVRRNTFYPNQFQLSLANEDIIQYEGLILGVIPPEHLEAVRLGKPLSQVWLRDQRCIVTSKNDWTLLTKLQLACRQAHLESVQLYLIVFRMSEKISRQSLRAYFEADILEFSAVEKKAAIAR